MPLQIVPEEFIEHPEARPVCEALAFFAWANDHQKVDVFQYFLDLYCSQPKKGVSFRPEIENSIQNMKGWFFMKTRPVLNKRTDSEVVDH